MTDVARRFVQRRDLLQALVARDMKLRYKRSVLGVAWTVLNPLAQLLVYYFVFGVVLTFGVPHFASFLLCGILVWNWFQSTLMLSTEVVVANAYMLRVPGFPPAILPLTTVVSNAIHFILALPVLMVLLVLDDAQVGASLALLPFLIVLQMAFSLALSFVVAAVQVTFRDTTYLLGIVLQLAFFLTPIFYQRDVIPAAYQTYYGLNPMLHLVEAYRAILIRGEFPAVAPLLWLTLAVATALPLTYRFYTNSSNHFVEEL